MKYNIPASDPRYLDATEAEMLHDLALHAIFNAGVARAMNPDAPDPRAIADEAVGERMVDDKRAFLGDEGVQRALRAISSGGTTSERPPMTITLRRSTKGQAKPEDAADG